MQNPPKLCPQCHAPIPADAPAGLCPACVLLGVAGPTNPSQSMAARAPALDEVAAAFPDLEILELVGQGGMGVVFKARQPRLDRLVALKILPPALAAQPGFSERFTREARVLARLAHPHIVAIYDFGESAGFFYLIMEFVDGVNLRAAMRAGVKPEQALLLIPKICEALQFAHDRGVLHRDIKPENILLDTRGTPKLADFGIAKLAGEDAVKTGLTATGAALGTAAYMAPEQVEKPATVDHRADIYSLGVVLYEMLTGELPLGRFGAPSEKSPVDRGVDEVVMRALEKERERRQQSAGEMKTQVEHASFGNRGSSADHLERSASSAGARPKSFEWVSKQRIFGLPLYHIVTDADPRTGEPPTARGIFAAGPVAKGLFACGGRAHGIVAMGGLCIGVIAVGGFTCGLLPVGGVSVGLVAFGGLAMGFGLVNGGLAIGGNPTGGIAIGRHPVGGLEIPVDVPDLVAWLLIAFATIALCALILGPVIPDLIAAAKSGAPPTKPARPRALACTLSVVFLLPAILFFAAVLEPILRQDRAHVQRRTAEMRRSGIRHENNIRIARERLDRERQRFAEGVVSALEVAEAECGLAIAEARGVPIKVAEAHVRLSQFRLAHLQEREKAGVIGRETVLNAEQLLAQALLQLERAQRGEPLTGFGLPAVSNTPLELPPKP